MTPDEFEDWEAQQVEALTNEGGGGHRESSAHIGDASTSAMPDTSLSGTSITTTASAARTDPPININDANASTRTPLSTNVVNTVSGGDGSIVFVTKKPRKVRKDKGVKRKKPTSPATVTDS
ncbi:hypothetical protein C0992_002622 [Termitomyces sp. T32_za158]|nr:hypothetical protein C0992_002622 [Termitomyces sp. T32_za158]